MPALPPHADHQSRLDYLLNAHVRPGYVVSTELLTRVGDKSDFATDVCIRKEGTDPGTGARYLEELAFEVVSEQSLRDVTDKAQDLTARGVRRVLAVFVKKGELKEWLGAWQTVARIEDPALSGPLPVAAVLKAAAADDAVAQALLAKGNRVLAEMRQASLDEGRRDGLDEGRREGARQGIVDLCEVLGVAVTAERQGRLQALSLEDLAALQRHLKQQRTWPLD